MPTKLKREDDIDSAYDYNPTARSLSDSEKATSGSYADAGIDQAEAFANDPANASGDVRDRETNATDDNGGWTVNRTPGGGAIKQGNRAIKILKKGGPAGAILGILLSLAGLVSFFGGPGLLIVNLAEVMTQKFNYQLASMDVRSDRIMAAKFKNSTTGVCSSVVSIRCKYSTFSKRELDNFKKAGFKVETDGKSISGRYKITSLELESGKPIAAKDFANELKNNPNFKTAMKRAYNPKFIGMGDKIFNRVARIMGINKAKPFDDNATDKERAAAVEDQTKNGSSSADGINCDEKCTDEEKAKNRAAQQANDLGDGASDGLNQGAEILAEADDIEEAASKGALSSVGGTAASIIKITGPVDNACMVYGWVKTISMTAKAIRSVQMARYAMIFLKTASMIKAGVAQPKDVEYLGTLMTKVTKDSKGKLSKSATDSFGYRYAAFGDKGIDMAASPYIAGASFGGKIQTAVDTILKLLPGDKKSADKTCGVLANPIVQAGSAIVGVVSFFFGVGEVKLTAQAAIAPLIALTGMFLPAMIGDILGGNLVGTNTYGEATGNIITAGSGGMLSKVASNGGNAIMHPSDAKSYMQLQDTVLADYANYDRQTLSPFDTSSPNTFLGSIYTQLAPYISQSTTSTYGALASIGTLVGSTFANIATPKTFADDAQSFTECSDSSYRDMDIATDPFCNPVVGIPPKYLGDDPNTINDRLLAQGLIDEETGEPKGETYLNLVKDCIERQDPYASSADGEEDHTDTCFIDSQQKADMYVHYIDQRNLDAMENGLPNPGGDVSSDSSQTATGNYALPVDQKWYDENPVWFSKPHHDYPAADIPVPLGTPVYAITSGRVTAAPNGNGYGVGVTIMGDDGIQYDYGHGSDGGQIVKTGDSVKAGQLIMHSASTGNSTGPHLHVGMKLNGVKLCPQNLLVALGKHESTLPAVKSLPTSGCSN